MSHPMSSPLVVETVVEPASIIATPVNRTEVWLHSVHSSCQPSAWLMKLAGKLCPRSLTFVRCGDIERLGVLAVSHRLMLQRLAAGETLSISATFYVRTVFPALPFACSLFAVGIMIFRLSADAANKGWNNLDIRW